MGIVCAEKTEASCWTGSFHSHMVQDVDCPDWQITVKDSRRSARSSSIHGVLACLHFLKLYKLVRLKYLSGCLKASVFFEYFGLEITFIWEKGKGITFHWKP